MKQTTGFKITGKPGSPLFTRVQVNSIDQGLLIKCIRADDKIYFCRILYSYLFDLVKSAEFSDILSVILQTATSQVLHHCPYNRYRYVEADDFFHKYFTIR